MLRGRPITRGSVGTVIRVDGGHVLIRWDSGSIRESWALASVVARVDGGSHG